MLITLLLLAVLTIGAVSATENVDAVAVEDTGDENVVEAPADEEAVEADEINDVLNDVNPDDFNVWVTNKTLDVDEDEEEVVMNFTSPVGAEGDFDIFVNGELKESISLNATTAGKTINVTLYDLSITEYGSLPVSFSFNDGPSVECGTLTVFEYYSAEDDFDTFPFYSVTDEKYELYSFSQVPALGTLMVYVDGKLRYSKYIDDDEPDMQLFVGDLNITENGKYNIRTEYNVTENGQLIVVDDFNVTVSCMPVGVFLNEEGIDLLNNFTTPSLGSVYDGDGVIGTIAAYMDDIEVFNRTYFDSETYSVALEGFSYYEGFTLGNHMVKIVYLKNNLKQYVAEGMIEFYAEPKILNPYNIYEGEDKNITVRYYNGSTGTLVVYNAENDTSSPTGWKKGTVFMTESLNGNGTVVVPLKTLTIGYHGFYFNITLGDYSIEKFVSVNVQNRSDIKPYIDLEIDVDDIEFGDDAVICISELTGYQFAGNLTVKLSAYKSGKYVEIAQSEVSIKDGVWTAIFSNLNASEYKVDVSFLDSSYQLGQYTSNFTVEQAESDIYFDEDEIELNVGIPLNITVDVENALGIVADIDGDDVAVNGNVVQIPALGLGSYTLTITTIVDDNHVEDSIEVTINVTKAKSTIVMDKDITLIKGGSANVAVETEGAIGFDAVIVAHPDALSVNESLITISGLEVGLYTLSVTTIPDENHTAATENATVTVNKLSTVLASGSVSAVYNDGKTLVATLKDAQGKTIANVKISTNIKGLSTLTTDKNGQVKWIASSLVPDTYNVVLTFAGNADYLKSTKKVTVKVVKATPKLVVKAKTFKKSLKNKNYAVTLKNNKDKAINKAKLTLKVNSVTYKATTNSKGKATFNLKKLTKTGRYTATVKFAGDKYYKNISKKVKITVKK